MNRRRADTVVGVIVGTILLSGGALAWQAYQQRRAVDQTMGSMMDSSMGTMHGTDPQWYVFGTLLLVAGIGGAYLLVREEIPATNESGRSAREGPDSVRSPETGSTGDEGSVATMDDESSAEGSVNPEAQPQARVLDLLPDDERRVLDPVLTSPGITQIELRDRSKFSKSKVSQTVSELEKRGLLYRERQGRTYRIYPSDDLREKKEL